MTRSELMSRIRSTGNASTELALAKLFRHNGVTGWRRQQRVAGVNVDFVFRKMKVAIFTDGCFWHGCPSHCRLFMRRYDQPRLSPFWEEKIRGNMRRDAVQTRALIAQGWEVVRVWEHELKGAAK